MTTSEPDCCQLNQRYTTCYMDRPHNCNEQPPTISQPWTDMTRLSEVWGTKKGSMQFLFASCDPYLQGLCFCLVLCMLLLEVTTHLLHLVRAVDLRQTEVKKGMIVYSAVSSPLDSSKCFTFHPLADMFIPTPTRLLCAAF